LQHVSNKELRAEIARFQREIRENQARERYQPKSNQKRPTPRPTRAPERLGERILLLCTNLAEHQSWRGYTYKQDMIQCAAMGCLYAAGKIDLSRGSSCFSYLTSTAWRRFAREVPKEHKRGFRAKDGERPEIESMPMLALGNFPGGAQDARFWPDGP
jgi:hypothetical protein